VLTLLWGLALPGILVILTLVTALVGRPWQRGSLKYDFFKTRIQLLIRQTKEKTDDENESNELQSVVTQSNVLQNFVTPHYSRLVKITDGQITRRKY